MASEPDHAALVNRGLTTHLADIGSTRPSRESIMSSNSRKARTRRRLESSGHDRGVDHG